MPATRTKERQPRDVAINLRANRRQRALIDRAAEALGKNRSDFMLEAACREANTVLVDRRFLLVVAGVAYLMMFAGLGKRALELKLTPGICPSCGRATATPC